MTIGEKVKALVKVKKWEQQDLADKSGVGITQINKLVNDIGNPSIRTLERVAKAFEKELVIEFI